MRVVAASILLRERRCSGCRVPGSGAPGVELGNILREGV